MSDIKHPKSWGYPRPCDRGAGELSAHEGLHRESLGARVRAATEITEGKVPS